MKNSLWGDIVPSKENQIKKCVSPSVSWPFTHQICLAQNSIHTETQSGRIVARSGLFFQQKSSPSPGKVANI